MTSAGRTTRKARKDRALRPIPPAVLKAARKTLLLRGVRRTSMGDIAEAAGIPRPTLCEYVSGRDELIDLVLAQRLKEISEGSPRSPTRHRRSQMPSSRPRSRRSAPPARTGDHEHLRDGIQPPGAPGPRGPAPGRREDRRDVFLEPVFRRGVSSGDLCSDVSQDLIVNWVRAVYSAYIVREEVDIDEARTMMRKFLVPALRADSRQTL